MEQFVRRHFTVLMSERTASWVRERRMGFFTD